ncbi:MAG: hypothetical protein IH795_02065 [Bacteroidetes bacterium]|nr:hypothetical protein [Bacteroidota bacterium]
MKFKSKTALHEHIIELIRDKYLIEDWKIEYIDDKTRVTRVYTVNFEAVENE